MLSPITSLSFSLSLSLRVVMETHNQEEQLMLSDTLSVCLCDSEQVPSTVVLQGER